MWSAALHISDRSDSTTQLKDSGPVELINYKTDKLDLNLAEHRPLKSRLSCDFMDTSGLPPAPEGEAFSSGGGGGGGGAAGGGGGGGGGGSNSIDMEETSGWSKFRLLLWKNWVVQRRHKVQTLVEIALPVFFASLLVLIRDLAPADVFNNATVYPAYRLSPELPDIPSAASIVGSKVNFLAI